ncbi:aldo/keto reductase [Sphingobium sp. SA2]|uniref:aldo/keto reductase n=1 Tax=Sphingobium sp. SA2 TaxID=1524832 RepID=UPI0028C28B68|nr:aldo/keto reductase [Sphingobium sp. SA2]MDT7532018.1 aldo/keto reductase [Sphingobium sp. SA2]
MEQRAIPSTGESLPVIGCGTYRGFDVPEERIELLIDVVTPLLDHGGTMIDSSPMYGEAEANVGRVMAATGRRHDAFLATKVWTRGRATRIAQMERSLNLLQTDHVDLMQVHNLIDARHHLDTLAGWKADGRTRYVGVSHYHSGAYEELEEVLQHYPLDFVQINYSIEDPAAERRILPLARDKGIAVIVNMPFGGGRYLATAQREPLPDMAIEIGCDSWSQLFLKYVIGHDAVTCVIPGTGNAAHMAQNMAAGSGALAQDRERIIAWWHDR